MAAERINPPNLYNSVQNGFSHAARQRTGGTVHLAGQVGWDQEGSVPVENEFELSRLDRTIEPGFDGSQIGSKNARTQRL